MSILLRTQTLAAHLGEERRGERLPDDISQWEGPLEVLDSLKHKNKMLIKNVLPGSET